METLPIEPEQWTTRTNGWQCIEEAGREPRPSRIIDIIRPLGDGRYPELIATLFYDNHNARRQEALADMIARAPRVEAQLAAIKPRTDYLEGRVQALEAAIRGVLVKMYTHLNKDAETIYSVPAASMENLLSLMYEPKEPQGSA
jgi:hypothetical protein